MGKSGIMGLSQTGSVIIVPELLFCTERLLIREYHKKDIDSFLQVVRQPELYHTTYGIPREYTKRRAKQWLRFIHNNIRYMLSYEFGMFLKENEQYIGNVGLINVSKDHNHADISYYIDTNYRNRGYTTEAAREMLRFGFEVMGFEKISGLCMSINTPSRRVMEKIGMQFEGTLRKDLLKDGIYYDMDHLSILKEEYFTNSKVVNPLSFQH